MKIFEPIVNQQTRYTICLNLNITSKVHNLVMLGIYDKLTQGILINAIQTWHYRPIALEIRKHIHLMTDASS